MGLYKISLYDRGWLEWSSLANNTIQTGANGAYKSTTVINELLFNKNFTTTQTTTSIINQTPVIPNNEKPFATETTKQQQTSKSMKPTVRPNNSSDLIYKNQFDLIHKNSASVLTINNKILILILTIFVFLKI
jgi:hypothetical protein